MILVRHGQSAWNAVFGETRIDPGIPDPALTALGRDQAYAAGRRLAAGAGTRRITALLASPYRRTLETAEIIAEVLGVAVTIEPLVRERAAFSCDTGSPRASLMARWPHWDWGRLDIEHWWHECERHGPESEDSVATRTQDFIARMLDHAARSEVCVVTHWGFIRAMTGQGVVNGALVPYDFSVARQGRFDL